MVSNSAVQDTLYDATTKNLKSTWWVSSLDFRINGEKQVSYTPNMSPIAQEIAKKVLALHGLWLEWWENVAGRIDIDVWLVVVLEAISNAEKVSHLLEETSELKKIIERLGRKIEHLSNANSKKERTEDDIFMIDDRLGTVCYKELWGFLKNEQSCYDYAQHISHSSKDLLEETIKWLHIHKIPEWKICVWQTIQFDWPEAARESKQTKTLRSRLWAPLQRDSVEDSTITELFELAQNKTNIEKVTQYCILRYAAWMPLKA